VSWLKARYAKTLDWSLAHPFQVISSSLALLIVALMVFPSWGGSFFRRSMKVR
jgi:multidrug efflux pump subunit AcrB